METLTITIQYLLLIGLGYLLKKCRILSDKDARPISKVILYLTLPAVIISSFSNSVFNTWMLISIILGIVYSSLMLILILMIKRKSPREIQAFYALNCSGLNLGNVAIPFLVSANPSSVVYAGMYSTGDSVLALGGTYAVASMLVEHESKNRLKTVVNAFLSSPPFFAFVIMTIIVIAGIPVPDAVKRFCNLLGGANTPLCMIFIGLSLNFSKGAVNLKAVWGILAYRLVCACLFAFLTLFCIPNAPLQMKQAIAVCVFSAIPNIALIYTQNLRLDTATAGLANTLSSILAIPLLSVMNILVT